MDKNITCFFTGHRSIPSQKREKITAQVERAIRMLYSRGYRSFICGGAVGFDQLCADLVLRLKNELEGIELRLILPCLDQDKFFTDKQKESYRKIRAAADKIDVLYQNYTRSCMLERNRKMADESSVCVAYCIKDTGGTAYTIGYAAKKNILTYRVGL